MIRTLSRRLVLLLACCGAFTWPAFAEMVFNVATLGNIDSLDPHAVSGVRDDRVLGDIYLGLTTEAPDGSTIPGAAESWTISDDGTVYRFSLRPLRWSDGQPFTAADFAYSMKRVIDPATNAPYASVLYPIKNAEAIHSGRLKDLDLLAVRALDEWTLEVTLEGPTPYFLGQLTHYSAFPVPRHLIEKHGPAWSKLENIATNGAYKVVEWQPESHIKAVKNPFFYDADNIAVDAVYYHIDNDVSQALELFRAGRVDAVLEFPSDQLTWLKTHLPEETRIAPFQGVYYYVVNVHKPPFDDRRVRQALSMAIDRQAITDKVLRTGELPAYSLVPPGTSNYRDPAYVAWKDVPYEQRVEQAKALLAEAGFGPDNPLEFTISYNRSGAWENHQKIAAAITEMWEPLHDAKIAILSTDVNTHYENLRSGNFDIARAGWIADYDDPQNFLFLLESTSGSLNYGRYANAQFDALMKQASQQLDLDARAQTLARAEAIAMEDQALIPIYYYITKQVIGTHVQNFVSNTVDVHRTRWLSVNR